MDDLNPSPVITTNPSLPTDHPIAETAGSRPSKKKFYYIIGGVVLLIALLSGGYLLVTQQANKPDSTTTTDSEALPQPKLPNATFPTGILSSSPTATPTSSPSVSPTKTGSPTQAINSPDKSTTSGTTDGRAHVTVSTLLSYLPKATVPAADISLKANPSLLAKLADLFRLIWPVSLAQSSATLPVYAWNDPVFDAEVKAVNDPTYGKQMALALATNYGMTEANFVSDEYEGVFYRATFTSNSSGAAISYRLPGLEISNDGFSQQYQATPFNVSHDQIIAQARHLLLAAKFSYSNLDWDHAYVENAGGSGSNLGYYVRVTIPTNLGHYRLLNDNSASDIVVTFDASDHFNIVVNNDTTYNTFSSLGNFSILSLSQAKQKLKTDGGYLNCVDLTAYLSSEDQYQAQCNHVMIGLGNGFADFGGTLTNVTFTSTELLYIKVRNPRYPDNIFTATVEPKYYFIPAYRFAGTATAHYDLTRTQLNSANQPTNQWAVERNGQPHTISIIVPAVDQF